LGGAVVFPDLRLIIEMAPGDLLLFPDHLIDYHFEPVQTGTRHSLITCVHEKMSKFWESNFGFISPLHYWKPEKTKNRGSKKKKNRGARIQGPGKFKQGKAAVKKESAEHRVVVKKESAEHRAVVKKESAEHRAVVKKESAKHSAVAKKES
jgi:hypothetical protein